MIKQIFCVLALFLCVNTLNAEKLTSRDKATLQEDIRRVSEKIFLDLADSYAPFLSKEVPHSFWIEFKSKYYLKVSKAVYKEIVPIIMRATKVEEVHEKGRQIGLKWGFKVRKLVEKKLYEKKYISEDVYQFLHNLHAKDAEKREQVELVVQLFYLTIKKSVDQTLELFPEAYAPVATKEIPDRFWLIFKTEHADKFIKELFFETLKVIQKADNEEDIKAETLRIKNKTTEIREVVEKKLFQENYLTKETFEHFQKCHAERRIENAKSAAVPLKD